MSSVTTPDDRKTYHLATSSAATSTSCCRPSRRRSCLLFAGRIVGGCSSNSPTSRPIPGTAMPPAIQRESLLRCSRSDAMEPFDGDLVHFVGDRVIPVSSQAIDAGPDQEISYDLLCCAEKLVNVTLAITNMDASSRMIQQQRRLLEIFQPPERLVRTISLVMAKLAVRSSE